MEEWKGKLPFNILRHVVERGVDKFMQIARAAEVYALLMGSLNNRGHGATHNVRSSSGERGKDSQAVKTLNWFTSIS